MKKLAIVLLMLLSIPTFAQHLTFMGIPIDGTQESFYSKLESKGFERISNSVGGSMIGEFAGRSCVVYCTGNPIYQVNVNYARYKGYTTLLSEGGSINSIRSVSAIELATKKYNELTSIFQKKYGYPKSVEDTRNESPHTVLLGRYEVITKYGTSNGEIFVTLSINEGSSFSNSEPIGSISITYKDKANYPYRTTTEQDIYNDI